MKKRAADEWLPATQAIHVGYNADDAKSAAVMPPLVLSSTFRQASPGEAQSEFSYSRVSNPNRAALESNVAALEQAAQGFAFASGCAAASSILQSLPAGSHVIAGEDIYGGTYRLLEDVFASNQHIELSWVDLSDTKALHQAFRSNTKLLWLESPSNPLLRIHSIADVAAIAHQHAAQLVVDNTFATPVLQQPLTLGADVVMHSTTKYLNGHSDVIGGIVLTSDDVWAERLRFAQKAIGAVPSPFDCYLALRGIKTLFVRMKQHCTNAETIAQWLNNHAQVKRVHYPGLSTHDKSSKALAQMTHPGAMLSFVLKGSAAQCVRFAQATRLFTLAESLGGVESLIAHPATMTHASVPIERRKRLGIDDNLLRLSVGIEAVDDLIADLAQAFAAACLS